MLDYPLELIARLFACPPPTREGTVGHARVDPTRVGESDLYFAVDPGDPRAGLKAAAERGAAAAVVRRGTAASQPRLPLLEVDDPEAALLELASWHRDRFSPRVALITGATGTGIVTDLARAIVGRHLRVLTGSVAGGMVGLCLDVLELKPQTEVALIDGRAPGEEGLGCLTRFLRPTIVAIPNSDRPHEPGGAGAPPELRALDALPWGGMAVLNADDPAYPELRARLLPGTAAQAYGLDQSERGLLTGSYLGPEIGHGADGKLRAGSRCLLRGVNAQSMERSWVPVLGRVGASYALAAAAVGQVLGISWPRIRRGLAEAEMFAPRMTVKQLPGGGILLHDGAAAPDGAGLKCGLHLLAELPGFRTVVVVDAVPEAYRRGAEVRKEVGQALSAAQPGRVLIVGEEGAATARSLVAHGVPEELIETLPTAAAAVASYQRARRPGDVVLVHGRPGGESARVAAALEGSGAPLAV